MCACCLRGLRHEHCARFDYGARGRKIGTAAARRQGGATHAPAWQDELLRTREGDCRATAGNLQLILRNDEAVRGLFRYNEFTARVDVVGDVPGPVALPQGPLTDAHLAALGAWLSSKKPTR
jgi:predicted P-loop ATPase